MFNFLKKDKEKSPETSSVDLINPIDGKVVDLSEVPDPVFSQKMVGDGFAVEPSTGEVFAPVSGEVVLQPDGYHACGIKTDEGLEVLVHLGLETVNLNGEGFTPHVKVGDKVKQGDLILSVDLEKIRDKVPSMVSPVLVTNLGDGQSLSKVNFDAKQGEVAISVSL